MSSENPTWYDIKSETMTRDEYFVKFGDKPEIKSTFESYSPKTDVIKEIHDLLLDQNQSIKILALGAGWCKDCTTNVPKLVKIVDNLPNERVELRMLYGVKVNPYRKPGEPIWSKHHSPPETQDPKFAVTKIPMIYFFDKSGEFLGKIVENPKRFSTIEECILAFLREKS
ncbi:MAG: thioredoxin family protein [Candidatus Lokiarchaeota archaeon]|nr:thioredoxin family protein [Candidatus Lokiarchaeota archaeon]